MKPLSDKMELIFWTSSDPAPHLFCIEKRGSLYLWNALDLAHCELSWHPPWNQRNRLLYF